MARYIRPEAADGAAAVVDELRDRRTDPLMAEADVSLTQAEYALLLHGHAWIRSVDPHASLSRGWAVIVVEMLDVLAIIMDEVATDHPGARVVEFSTTALMGRMRVCFALAGVSGPPDAVCCLLRAVVARAEARTARTCERCGAPGRLHVDERLVTLCDAHAIGQQGP